MALSMVLRSSRVASRATAHRIAQRISRPTHGGARWSIARLPGASICTAAAVDPGLTAAAVTPGTALHCQELLQEVMFAMLQPKQGKAVLDVMQQAGVEPDSSTFGPLIEAWGQAKQPEQAEAVLDVMQQAGVAPDNRIFGQLITVWGQAGQPDRAEAVLELMQQAGVAPDRSTFGKLIIAWAQHKLPDRAENVLHLMQKAGIVADRGTFGRLIKAWGLAKQPQRAEALLDLMQELGVAPDSITFFELIDAWCRAKQPEQAEAVLNQMQQAGVAPDKRTLTLLVEAWVKARRPDKTQAVLELMQQQVVLATKKPGQAEAVLDLMQQAGVAGPQSPSCPNPNPTFGPPITAWDQARQPGQTEALAGTKLQHRKEIRPLMSDDPLKAQSKPRAKSGCEVRMGNLPHTMDVLVLKELASEFGEVSAANIARDRETGYSRGFGFLTLVNAEQATHVTAQLDGKVVDGHKLDVKLAGANSVRQAIYFGNLSWDLDFDVLTSLCNKFGEIISAKIITDRETGRSKGFGFVTMSTKEQADEVVAQLDGMEVEGRTIYVRIKTNR